MDQKRIDTIIKIRLISYIIFPIITFIIVVTSIAQGFLSGHPALILAVVVSTAVIFGLALFYYFKHEMRKGSADNERRRSPVVSHISKLDYILSFVVALFEIVLIIFYHTALGITIVVVVGLVFSGALTYHLSKRKPKTI